MALYGSEKWMLQKDEKWRSHGRAKSKCGGTAKSRRRKYLIGHLAGKSTGSNIFGAENTSAGGHRKIESLRGMGGRGRCS